MKIFEIGQYKVYGSSSSLDWNIHCNKCTHSVYYKEIDGRIVNIIKFLNPDHEHPHLEEILKYCKVFL